MNAGNPTIPSASRPAIAIRRDWVIPTPGSSMPRSTRSAHVPEVMPCGPCRAAHVLGSCTRLGFRAEVTSHETNPGLSVPDGGRVQRAAAEDRRSAMAHGHLELRGHRGFL